MEDPIIVVGSGRCGTSAVAGILHRLGVFMGETFVSADANNPYGAWEDIEFRNLNVALQSRRITFDSWHRSVKKIIEARRSLQRPWGWKDPRTCDLLPHFLIYFRRPIFVRCTRNPDAIERSMLKAYSKLGWNEETARKCRESRQRNLEEHLTRYPQLVIDFDQLMADPAATVESIVEFIPQLDPTGERFNEAVNSIRPSRGNASEKNVQLVRDGKEKALIPKAADRQRDTDAAKEPRLSLCMIVKDEEAMLPRCLASAVGCVDEIVVVDTGSTDQTVEIARAYHARVYNHPWDGDFSKHQNQSVGYATGDWILQMDADEELCEGACGIIREAIRDPDADALLVTIVSFFNRGASSTRESKIRVFRNNSRIGYESIVHKQLKGYRCPKIIGAKILHHGYDLPKEALDKKHKRTGELIRRQIEKEPEKFAHRLNLSVCYSAGSDFEGAIDQGLSALKLAGDQGVRDSNVLWAHYIVAASYLKLDDLDSAEHYAIKATKLSADHLDSYFILTLVYHARKDWVRLWEVTKECLRIFRLLDRSPERFAASIVNMANEKWRIHIANGDMYLHKRDVENALKEFGMARSVTSVPGECHRITGDCFRNAGWWEQAQTHYEMSLRETEGDVGAVFGLAMVHKHLGNLDMYTELMDDIKECQIDRADILFEKGTVSLKRKDYVLAIDYFKRVLALAADYYPAYQNLALSYELSGQWEQAIEVNLRFLKEKPDSIDARVNMGYLCYQMGDVEGAKEIFLSALKLDPKLTDVRILLCEIYLNSGHLEKCVSECDHILEALELPRNVILNSLTDLAGLFRLIGRKLAETKISLSRKALKIAHQLEASQYVGLAREP